MQATVHSRSRAAASLPFWRQIRWSLTLYLIGFTVVPLVVVALVAISRVREHTTNQISAQLESVAVLKQGQIDQWLERVDVLIHVYGNEHAQELLDSVATDNTTSADQNAALNETLRQALVSPLHDHEEGDTTGEAAEDEDGAEKGEAAREEEEAEEIEVDYTEFFVYRADGVIVAATDELEIGKVVTRQPYFEQSLEDDYISPPYYDLSSGELTMMATHGIENEAGEVVGVLAGRLELDELEEIMFNRSGLGETGETYLISLENNYFITRSRYEGYPLERTYRSVGIDAALSGQDGSGVYMNYQAPAVEVIGAYLWLPELQAALIAEESVAQAFAPYQDTITLTIGVTFVVALLAAVFGSYLISQITRPAATLARTARAVAGGDYGRRAEVAVHNELGLVADAFNQMTERLVENIDALDTRVQEVNEANEALQIATAEAREASRLKDEFLAVMSHELRTPLNAIIGYTGIMQMSMGLPERALHMTRRVRANSERLLNLINDVLDISRIESGRLELVPSPVNVRELVQKLEGQMSVLAEQKTLALSAAVAEDVPDVISADLDSLTKIVTNLVSNAIKFTEQGQVALNVSRQEQNLVVEVSDTGVGIPPHLHQVIFERFRQADSSNKRAHGGTGLGLAIVHHLCTAMGGSVRVTSTIGEGSTFIATLPLLTEAVSEREVNAV